MVSFAVSWGLGDPKAPVLLLPDGQTKIKINRLLTTSGSRKKGLSGVLPSSFGPWEGALFVFEEEGWRSFWMPDTHFDLDIIFMDRNFKITHIERNVPKHPSRKGNIPKVAPRWAKYVLEIRSRTPLVKKIQKGMKLKFKTFKKKTSPEQTKSNTRLSQ
ncbi:MAG: DUF192 domain-containing protein [Bacteriovoracales bacterium]|nr:DUF192 domain-containing protein [Bacteriovoracales bacterium]